MSGLSDTSAFEAFNRMAEKIEESERRSLAQAEVAEALSGDTLEQDFLRLEAGGGDADVDDRLLALKAEMGLIAAPAAEEPKALTAGEDDEEEEGEVDAPAQAPEDAPVADAVLLEEFEQLEKKAPPAE
jgi:phage shock protein A